MYEATCYDLQQKSFQEKPAAEQNCLISSDGFVSKVYLKNNCSQQDIHDTRINVQSSS